MQILMFTALSAWIIPICILEVDFKAVCVTYFCIYTGNALFFFFKWAVSEPIFKKVVIWHDIFSSPLLSVAFKLLILFFGIVTLT